eukprot:4014764-Pleurochrysis_carterae.AAC.1
MHSRRVGDLNAVLVPSVYLGLTNSGILPDVIRETAHSKEPFEQQHHNSAARAPCARTHA